MSVKELVVELNGKQLDAARFRLLLEVRVQQKLSLPTVCELAFLVGPQSDFHRRMPIGASLVVRASTANVSGAMFSGEITSIEHVYNPDDGPQMRIRAFDQLHRLRKRHRISSYVQVTLAELAGQLMNDAGVKASVSLESAAAKWQRIIQTGESNFDFLSDHCAACGLYFTLRGDELLLISLQGTGDPVPLTLGASLVEATFEINGNRSARQTRVSGWNPRRAEIHDGEATKPRSGRLVAAQAPPQKVGGRAECHLPGRIVEGRQQAQALAQAELDVRVASEVTLRGLATGNPLLRPGAPIQVNNAAADVSGVYILTEVNHLMTGEGGYVSEISTEPPAIRQPSNETLFALGRVSRVDDPERCGRVQIALSAYQDVETDWLQVVAAGAGKAKGINALPSVGDSVLVLVSRSNMAQGVVLGGLYGIQESPDDGVEGGRTRRFSVHTPGGHQLMLDDAKDVLRVQGSHGSFIEFAPGGVRLHAGADLDIAAPGKSITIKGSKIDFQSG